MFANQVMSHVTRTKQMILTDVYNKSLGSMQSSASPISTLVSCAGLEAPKVVSADCHAVRVWEAITGKGFTTIEGAEPSIRDVLLWPESGLLMLGCDAPQIQVRMAHVGCVLCPAPADCA